MSHELLFVFRHSPYGSSLGREGLEAALAAGAFDRDMAILFLDDAVWQLKSEQNTTNTQYKNHQKMTSALSMFGIDELYAEECSLNTRQLCADDLFLEVKVLDSAAIGALIRNAKTVLSF
ncbi:MAG: sulfurtransferase complex subunit TusC [Marinagarivorans sp.]|nr:sulfurtransferase complex subunit TusC [Marinagarivorans sp.]